MIFRGECIVYTRVFEANYRVMRIARPLGYAQTIQLCLNKNILKFEIN